MKFLLILLITFIFIRLILPGLLRTLLGGFVRKQMRNHGFEVPPQYQARPEPPSTPGQVRVDFVPPKKTIDPDQPHSARGGEYVDFEEVK